jgi:peptidoglycan/LPS O-acetylase OafA/YrhL
MKTISPVSQVGAHRFELLDFLRGIAAIAVLLYHSEAYFGFQLAPNAYLAVDMFFMLSGFVIAHNYDPKIANGLTFKGFMTQRAIRLYPCYLLAFVLGFILSSARLIRDNGYVDASGLASAALANLFMLPALNQVYHEGTMFPFNGASWSLFFELIANAVYWAVFRRLSGLLLSAILGVSLLLLVFVVVGSHTIDLGMRHGELFVGLPRVMFSFFVGIGIRRFVFDDNKVRSSTPAVLTNVVALIAAFCFSSFISLIDAKYLELIVVVVVFPVILTLTSMLKPAAWLRSTCKAAGDASYPIYIMQNPFILIAAALPQILFHLKVKDLTPGIGIAQVSLTILLAWVIDHYYELPVRQYLKQKLNKRKAAASLMTS